MFEELKTATSGSIWFLNYTFVCTHLFSFCFVFFFVGEVWILERFEIDLLLDDHTALSLNSEDCEGVWEIGVLRRFRV